MLGGEMMIVDCDSGFLVSKTRIFVQGCAGFLTRAFLRYVSPWMLLKYLALTS